MNSSDTHLLTEIARLRQALDHVPSAISWLSPLRNEAGAVTDFRVESANAEAARLWQTPKATVVGQSYATIFPGTADNDIAAFIRILAGSEPVQRDLPPTANGLPVWFEQRVVPVDGQLLLITTDVTSRRQTEQAEQRRREQQYQQQTDLLRSVLDGSQNAIIAFDAVRDPVSQTIVDFRYVLQNEANRQRVGRSDAVLLGRTMLEFFSEVATNGLKEQYVQLIKTGETLRFERQFEYNGIPGWFSYSAVKRGDGFVLTVHDKTAEQQAQVALRHQTEQLRTTLDASISSIFYMTAIREPATGRVVDFLIELSNKAVLRSNNLTPDEVVGERLLTKFPGNLESGFFDCYVRVVETGEPEAMTRPYHGELGSDEWFEVSAVKQGDNGVVVTFMNVTDLKRTEQQLRESNASLDQFASVASHDLQEPLRKIKSFSDLLLVEYGPALGDGVDLLRRVEQAADRMQTLIQSLLNYSRLSGGRIMPVASVDLNRLVGEVLVDLELIIQEKVAVIRVDALPVLMGNALQLRQVFQNLLGNALKFSKPSQAPVVSVAACQVARSALPIEVKLPGKPADSYWQISVIDNGIGFDATHRDRIFGAFERLHGRSSPYTGTGIGLAVVRKVTEHHGGTVVANGREGEGATFRIYLPVTD